MSDRDQQLADVASRLRQAYTNGAIQPLRDALDPTDVAGAYQVQALNTQFWMKGGRKLAGYKIGLTAKAVQQQLGVDQPDFGVLFRDMSIPSGGVLDMKRAIAPRAEAEVALILGEDMDHTDVTAEDVAAATRAACAAIEIVDSRIANWKITFADTVADNGSSAFYVLGDPRPLDGLDLYSCGMVLERDGQVASVGAGAACLGHPMKAAAWLANAMIERGNPLKAGQLILTGALGPMVDVTAGQQVRVLIGGLGEVSFSCRGAQ